MPKLPDMTAAAMKNREALTKICPSCQAEVPLSSRQCPLCGYAFGESPGAAPIADFIMTEIDLLKRSSFEWSDLFGDGTSLVANGFNAWGGVFFYNGRWCSVGGGKKCGTRLLAVGERVVCLAAADDWLNDNETDESAHKSRAWLREPATDRQLAYLPPECRQNYNLTRYQASALMTFRFNQGAIKALVLKSAPSSLACAS